MHIIYLHGLNSDANAIKGTMTADYARTQGIDVVRPDLNLPPSQVLSTILDLVKPDSVLIGSSLGGYFATLVSDLTGTPAVLLNPSIRPDMSFRRFLADKFADNALTDDTVIHKTAGGWAVVYGDLAWFDQHRLQAKHADKINVLLKLGDELLDANATHAFYQDKGAFVLAQAGGDHRMSDYADNVALVVDWAINLGT